MSKSKIANKKTSAARQPALHKATVGSSTGIRRLFIEVAPSNDYNKWELESSLDGCQDLSGIDGDNFWWKVVSEARFEPNLFQYIMEADEIYMSTAIMPLVYGTSIGSPELWNKMMKLAVEHNVTGKQIFNQRIYKDIEWGNLDKKLLDAAFKKNFLYVASDDSDKWEQVDIDKLLKQKRR